MEQGDKKFRSSCLHFSVVMLKLYQIWALW